MRRASRCWPSITAIWARAAGSRARWSGSGEQLADWSAAIGYAASLPGVDPARLAAWAFSASARVRLRARGARPAAGRGDRADAERRQSGRLAQRGALPEAGRDAPVPRAGPARRRRCAWPAGRRGWCRWPPSRERSPCSPRRTRPRAASHWADQGTGRARWRRVRRCGSRYGRVGGGGRRPLLVVVCDRTAWPRWPGPVGRAAARRRPAPGGARPGPAGRPGRCGPRRCRGPGTSRSRPGRPRWSARRRD